MYREGEANTWLLHLVPEAGRRRELSELNGGRDQGLEPRRGDNDPVLARERGRPRFDLPLVQILKQDFAGEFVCL